MRNLIALGVLAGVLIVTNPIARAESEVQINHLELNLKEYSNKKLPLGKAISVAGEDPLVTKVLYDQGYKGRICFISCHFYDGYTSKWTDFFVSLQPYESTCMAIAGGCNTTAYPKPDDEIKLVVGDDSFKVRMVDTETYSYYLPLDARQSIASNNRQNISINTSWAPMKVYEIGGKTKALLASLLNLDKELSFDDSEPKSAQEVEVKEPSLEEKIEEINNLLLKGLISKDEYKAMRERVLGL